MLLMGSRKQFIIGMALVVVLSGCSKDMPFEKKGILAHSINSESKIISIETEDDFPDRGIIKLERDEGDGSTYREEVGYEGLEIEGGEITFTNIIRHRPTAHPMGTIVTLLAGIPEQHSINPADYERSLGCFRIIPRGLFRSPYFQPVACDQQS